MIVLCVSGESEPAMAETLTRALQEVLGAQANVQLRRNDAPWPDEDLSLLAAREAATAVAGVVWRGQGRREAVLRIYLAESRRFVDRGLVFTTSDHRPNGAGRWVW